MRWVLEDLTQVVVAACSSTVLGRAGPCSVQAPGNGSVVGERGDAFDGDQMFPAIPKVVLVQKGGAFAGGETKQLDATMIAYGVGLTVVFWVWFPVTGALVVIPNDKLVEMGKLPAHRHLEDAVQFRERGGRSYHNPAPNGWFNTLELEMEVVDVSARVSGAAHDLSLFSTFDGAPSVSIGDGEMLDKEGGPQRLLLC